MEDNTRGGNSLVDKLLASIMATIVVIMTMQVCFRYVFNNSISWSEEVVRYLFVWLTFLGSAVCFRDKTHIGVEFFLDLLPDGFRGKMEKLNLIILLLFSCFLFVGGLIWVGESRGAYSSSIQLPVNIILYGALPVSSLLAIYFITKKNRGNK